MYTSSTFISNNMNGGGWGRGDVNQNISAAPPQQINHSAFCPVRLVKGNVLKMSIVSVSMHGIRYKVQFSTQKQQSGAELHRKK